LSDDWQQRWNHPVWAVESFVDETQRRRTWLAAKRTAPSSNWPSTARCSGAVADTTAGRCKSLSAVTHHWRLTVDPASPDRVGQGIRSLGVLGPRRQPR
jgi:hypothetical protein